MHVHPNSITKLENNTPLFAIELPHGAISSSSPSFYYLNLPFLPEVKELSS